jgi:hypothetical protein
VSKFTISSALLSGAVTPETCDEIAWLLEGGPHNRTAYMANAAQRRARRVEADVAMRAAWALEPRRTVKPCTEANWPADCGSRFD